MSEALIFSQEEIQHMEDLRTALNKREIAIAKRAKMDTEIDELNHTIRDLMNQK